MNLKLLFALTVSIVMASPLFGQLNHNHNHSSRHADAPLEYIANEGQWQENILFEAKVENGAVYLEQNCLTFSQLSGADLTYLDEVVHQDGDDWMNVVLNGHAWKVNFLNGSLQSQVSGVNKRKAYHNYFIGNDASKWAGNVPMYNSVHYASIYPNVDLKTYSDEGHFKYDFIVHPSGSIIDIQLEYEGVDGISLKNGNLMLETSVGEFTETAPYAYQIIDGKKVQVVCNYQLNGSVLSYELPEGYDETVDLIIDPTLVGATLSGTVGGSNYGHAATYDNLGNIYTGARNFSSGYPVTAGAFQMIAGGGQEIGISKLSPNATTLIYATHLGGSSSDLPHSMFVSNQNELFILGTTNSTNFPTSLGALDNTLGGTKDMIVTHFNATGTGIIGSTYVGGSGNDGSNGVTFNYGDTYRGEIIVDAAGNCLVTCQSQSADFPVTPGAFQTVHGGGGDAVVFKMNSTLSAMTWSTYVGGTGDEIGLGLRLDAAGDVYVSGACDLSFMTATGHQAAFAGGTDGFIIKLTNNGGTIPFSTYVGTAANDNAFFIDIDANNKIYVYGQTSSGSMTTTTGTYNVPLSRQYINRFDATLAIRDISSLIGGGATGTFVPIAFMVDDCGFIYYSGHSASSSVTLPISTTAIQTVGGMYLGVLHPDATGLYYATRYGGSGAHVDGGTSRFDPSGIVYQSVCTINGFVTTPNANSSTYPSGFDIGVFKIDFEAVPIGASATFTTNTQYCAPMTATFTNNSSGTDFLWDFGDGSPQDTATNPIHTFTNPGTFNVMLVANDSAACTVSDTAYFIIDVPSQFTIDLGPDTIMCDGTITLGPNFGDSATYLWQDGSTDSVFVANGPGTYYVTLTTGPCSATDTIVVTYETVSTDLGLDDFLCTGDNIILDAGANGTNYLWSDNSTNQTLTVTAPGTYWVTISNSYCSDSDTVLISGETTVPLFNVWDTAGCMPVVTQFADTSTSTAAIASYYWDFGDGTNSIEQDPSHAYNGSGNYPVSLTITSTNGCVYTYSRMVQIILTPQPVAFFTFLPELPLAGEEIEFTDQSANATSWYWDFGDGTFSTVQNPTHAYANADDVDVWLVTENNGCFDSIHANILFDEPLIYYVPNAFTPDGDGFNHVFQPVFTQGFSPYKYHLMIFNRWGETIFESFDHSMPWDGTYNGVVCPQGVYTWKIDFGEELTDKKYRLTGHVSLLK